MKDINFRIKSPKKGNKNAKIFLGGDLGVSNLQDIVKNLRATEEEYEKFEINVNDVSVCDLATIQMLISFKNTCIAHKKTVKFNIDLSKDTIELLEISGLSNIIKKL